MRIYAIDPGPVQSAIVCLDDGRFVGAHTAINQDINQRLRLRRERHIGDTLVVEEMACYGMPVGAEVFRTVWWSGRFAETWMREVPELAHYAQVPRQKVKLHLCGSVRAKDANVRQALVDRFGPGKATAIGTARHRGPLYGVHGDQWAALAVAITWWDGLTALTEGHDAATVRSAEDGGLPRHDHARHGETA